MKKFSLEITMLGIILLVGIVTSKLLAGLFLVFLGVLSIHMLFSKDFRNSIDYFFTGIPNEEQKNNR